MNMSAAAAKREHQEGDDETQEADGKQRSQPDGEKRAAR